MSFSSISIVELVSLIKSTDTICDFIHSCISKLVLIISDRIKHVFISQGHGGSCALSHCRTFK